MITKKMAELFQEYDEQLEELSWLEEEFEANQRTIEEDLREQDDLNNKMAEIHEKLYQIQLRIDEENKKGEEEEEEE